MGTVVAVIALALALAPGVDAPGRPTVPVQRFAISYERSGGIAAMPEALAIRPGRHATVTALDGRGKRRSVEFRVAPRKIRQLRAAAETASIGELPTSTPGSCADCYVYSVTYRGKSASVAEVDVPGRMQPLIDRAEALIAAHLPFH
jgi:hypothetical protein